MNNSPFSLATLLLLLGPVASAQQPYAGQEARPIKALSTARLEGLRAGAGLGYAKAAELNGWPGPLHALELADELALSADQRTQLEALRAQMLAEARPLGAALIEAEATLERLFNTPHPSPEAVEESTARIADLEGQLRAVHLVAHLRTKPVLSPHQRHRYAQLRGYGQGGHSRHQGHH